ncbi:RNA polymerase sigma factor [Brachybacterium sp. YJGR34]|uniref:RNA polymerase sigma factor n=1 Tax=Brachybacterium sp. YJGR34 TaxID=2059911 RepID=UPI000E0A6753|nr:RNA polymerase sigma factor [Brachybacterium sp. YJGR34]
MPGLPDDEDRALVLRAQDGDVGAFEALVDRHQGRLFRIAYLVLHDRMDAEDVVQESLVLAWKRVHLLADPSAFRSWVSQITHRAAIGVLRRAARRGTSAAEHEDLDRAVPGNSVGGVTGRNAGHPEQSTLANAQMEALATILQSIDEDQRACWVLREIDGMSYQEIARVVDATESTVRGRIARARGHILDRMKEWR